MGNSNTPSRFTLKKPELSPGRGYSAGTDEQQGYSDPQSLTECFIEKEQVRSVGGGGGGEGLSNGRGILVENFETDN